jgi:DNA-directed RNA polymerase subunit E'/Rpb7
MEQSVLFDTKVVLAPRDFNKLRSEALEDLLVKNLRGKLEGKCSIHGWVIPETTEILSRTMGQLENGRFTGNIVFHIQARGNVYNPASGTIVQGTVSMKNHNGVLFVYKDAIKVMVVRDLHLGNTTFESIQVGDTISARIIKSRFQVNDEFILSVAELASDEITRGDGAPPAEEAVRAPPVEEAPKEEEGEAEEEAKKEATESEGEEEVTEGEGEAEEELIDV